MVKKIIVLGGSGMLGSMLADDLSRDAALKITAAVRSRELAKKCRERAPEADWVIFDADTQDTEKALKIIGSYDWVINAIGIIRTYIHDDNAGEVERAIRINSIFPHQLARKAATIGAGVIQIATDCAFSGRKGNYTESDTSDALDVYGKSKSLGEVFSPGFFNLRCSTVGLELKEHKSLLDWFLGQPKNAKVNGYMNHRWNGITTLHFSRLCRAIIEKDIKLPHVQHVVPAGETNKCEMLQNFAASFHREDIIIRPYETPTPIDLTLKTNDEPLNLALWAAAGYSKPPTVPEMIAELAGFDYRFARM